MDQPSSMLGMLAGIQATRYTSAAALSIYLYDIILTLELEVSRDVMYGEHAA